MSMPYLSQYDVDEDRWDRLPRVCAWLHTSTEEPVLVTRGRTGYVRLPLDTDVDRFNVERRITRAQQHAMVTGAMIGWEAPSADPNYWDRKRGDKPGDE